MFTAILTGILVPCIKSLMDWQKFKRQKTFEALLARQSDVIKAQTLFLKEFSNYIWEYHKISQRVAYCGKSGDVDAYNMARQEYQNSMWESIHKIHSAIGAARWFASYAAQEKLDSWYESFKKSYERLDDLIKKKVKETEWEKHFKEVHKEANMRNRDLLRFLSKNFGLRDVVDDLDRTNRS